MTAEIFLQELQRLILSQPKRPVQVLNSQNCEMADYIYYGKDLVNCFDVSRTTGGTYLFDSHNCTNCADCDFTYQTELAYECVDVWRSFNCNYLDYCQDMTDSDYSFDCRGCKNVFGCVHLNNKSFCIFNRQFTEEEYKEKVKYLRTLPPEKILAVVNEMREKHPLTQTHEHDNDNSGFGNYVYFCKNCYLCFDTDNCENSGYLSDTTGDKSTYDLAQSRDCELSYELSDSADIFNSDHIIFSKNCSESSYLFDCIDTKNSIGCVRTQHKQYCILNRQFTKEEYERISSVLLADLKSKNPGWGNLVF
ncbi:MAG TPA: hypothetical protein VLG67_00335 [Candidatus Saccharimonadales bacterium]|nr:hypothetical protein [Candidatus Saccharimonadales bacterium]